MVLGGYETAEYETSVSNRAGKGRMLCARDILYARGNHYLSLLRRLLLYRIYFLTFGNQLTNPSVISVNETG